MATDKLVDFDHVTDYISREAVLSCFHVWYCSECGCCFEDWDEKPTYNYCPNCGADMREPNLDTTKGEGCDESSG